MTHDLLISNNNLITGGEDGKDTSVIFPSVTGSDETAAQSLSVSQRSVRFSSEEIKRQNQAAMIPLIAQLHALLSGCGRGAERRRRRRGPASGLCLPCLHVQGI